MSVKVINPSSASGESLVTGTKRELLAVVPSGPTVGYATDVEEFFIFDGTYWNVGALRLARESVNPDLGYSQRSGERGFGDYYITDKTLSNMVLGSNAREENGAIKINKDVTPNTFEVYLRGQWNTIIYDFTTEYGDLRHTPLNEQIKVWRGDSVKVGLSGNPIIQEYKASMGAYPPKKIISGGTF